MLVRRIVAALLPTAVLLATHVDASVPVGVGRAIRGEAAIFTHDSPVGDLTYTPGRGFRVGDTGLTLGGYTNATFARDEGDTTQLELDDLSLFVIVDPTPRLHLFAEIEYADAATVHGGHVGSPDDALTAERLFADVRLHDAVNLRAGVFLTPVGRWNLMHAAPLVWTTSRPLTTEAFDPSLTGVMLYGTVFPAAGALTYSLFDQFAPPLEGNPEFRPADHSAGARLELALDPAWSIGASYLAARRDGDTRHLGGLDVLWVHPRVEVTGEAVLADGGEAGVEWGGYLQAALAVTERLSIVERYEHFAAPRPARSLDLVSLGLAFSLVPGTVVKAEYLIAGRSGPHAEPGFKASIATLF